MNRQHIGDRAPGSYAAYRVDGCRCYPCCDAKKRYRANLDQGLPNADRQPLVDAAPVREHLLRLRTAGIGPNRMAQLTGMSRNSLRLILRGDSTSAMRTRVRAETAALILAVRPDINTAADRALIDPTGTLRRVRALVALGYSFVYLDERLGLTPGNVSGFAASTRVMAKTARAVRALYDELAMKTPASLGISEASYARAARYGANRGWPKPLNWDDDEIDDPNAQPHYGRPAPGERPMRRADALREDALFIIDNSPVNLTERRDRDRVAAQLGIGIDYLDKILAKAA